MGEIEGKKENTNTVITDPAVTGSGRTINPTSFTVFQGNFMTANMDHLL